MTSQSVILEGAITPRSEFFAGIKAELPILIGVAPFGLIYGVSALKAGLPPSAAQAMSSIVFAGSAQFISAQLFGQSAPALVIFITAAIINLRHMLYSASIAPYTSHLKPIWKWILAYLLTDEAYAVTILHYSADNSISIKEKHWFFLGAGLALWTCWQLSTAVGIFLGTQIPASWSLDFTIVLTFIALVIPILKDKATLTAALVAGFTALIFASLPLKLGIVTASLLGITAGILVEGRGK